MKCSVKRTKRRRRYLNIFYKCRGGVMKKTKKIISSITTALLFAVLIVMVVAVISSKASGGEPSFLGYQLKPVLSGSMEPTFMTGSIIAIRPVEDPTTLKKDDV